MAVQVLHQRQVVLDSGTKVDLDEEEAREAAQERAVLFHVEVVAVLDEVRLESKQEHHLQQEGLEGSDRQFGVLSSPVVIVRLHQVEQLLLTDGLTFVLLVLITCKRLFELIFIKVCLLFGGLPIIEFLQDLICVLLVLSDEEAKEGQMEDIRAKGQRLVLGLLFLDTRPRDAQTPQFESLHAVLLEVVV